MTEQEQQEIIEVLRRLRFRPEAAVGWEMHHADVNELAAYCPACAREELGS